jgi:hypothetical protein
MKIVICVIFTVYKPEKQVDFITGMKQQSFVFFFRNLSGEEPEVPLNHIITDCNTLCFRSSVSQYERFVSQQIFTPGPHNNIRP